MAFIRMINRVSVSQLRHICICKCIQARIHLAIVLKEYEQAKSTVGGQICVKILPLSWLTISLFPETTAAITGGPTGANRTGSR